MNCKDKGWFPASGPDPIMRLFKFNPPIGNITISMIYDIRPIAPVFVWL